MAEIKKDNLEKALDKDKKQEVKMPKEMEIGFHQGAINTLLNERNEFFKLFANIDAIIQAHIKRLEELGVKVTQKKND